MSGVAGKMVREKRIARATGTEVSLIDADHPECTDFQSEEGGRWVTVCEDHGSIVQHETWKLARQFLGHPEEWCDACREGAPGTVDSRGGFSAEERQRALATRRAKAEEKRKEQEVVDEKKRAKLDLDQQWTDWTVGQPLLDRLYLPAEKKAHDVESAVVKDANFAARSAKTAHRQAEERLADLPKIKSKREQKNRDRLEEEAASLDAIVVAETDRARIAGEMRDQLARRAFLRACVRAGWRITFKGGHSGSPVLSKADVVLKVPANYLPAEDYQAVKTMPEDLDG